MSTTLQEAESFNLSYPLVFQTKGTVNPRSAAMERARTIWAVQWVGVTRLML